MLSRRAGRLAGRYKEGRVRWQCFTVSGRISDLVGGVSRESERNRDEKRRAIAGDAGDLHPSAEGFDAVMESDEP